jgi:hypothetical protein
LANKFEKTLNRLFAPVVAYKGWEDAVTDEMRNNILNGRLANATSETATDMDAIVYLHTASLATPLGKEMLMSTHICFQSITQSKPKG